MTLSKRKQYPPQTGQYIVKVKNGSQWRDFNTCRLQISVGQAYHEGDKFEATINWVKERFSHVIICVNDTLQRYNYIFEHGISEQHAKQISRIDGDEWIKRNLAVIETLPNYKIYRWDHWIKHPRTEHFYGKARYNYETHEAFYNSMQHTISNLWARKIKQNKSFYENKGFGHFQNLSKQYLLEETAAFSCMFENTHALDIYPGTVLLPSILFNPTDKTALPEGLISGYFTRIDFLRNTSLTAKQIAA